MTSVPFILKQFRRHSTHRSYRCCRLGMVEGPMFFYPRGEPEGTPPPVPIRWNERRGLMGLVWLDGPRYSAKFTRGSISLIAGTSKLE